MRFLDNITWRKKEAAGVYFRALKCHTLSVTVTHFGLLLRSPATHSLIQAVVAVGTIGSSPTPHPPLS